MNYNRSTCTFYYSDIPVNVTDEQMASLLEAMFNEVTFEVIRSRNCTGYEWEWEALTFGGDMEELIAVNIWFN